MALNLRKCLYMSLGSKSEINDFILEDRFKIPLTLEYKATGIKIDTKLNF